MFDNDLERLYFIKAKLNALFRVAIEASEDEDFDIDDFCDTLKSTITSAQDKFADEEDEVTD